MTTSPSPDTLATLIGAAFHNERVAARRMAAREGLDEAEALRRVMTQSATAQGLAGLAELLAARARLKRDEAERRAAKLAARSEKVAAMKARAQPAPEPGAWQAWFDGSAHPNPGRLGIGGLLLGPAGERIEISERAGHGNSGQAEYLALVALLEAAVAARPGVLAIYGDSQVVIGDVAGGAGAAGLEQHRERALDLLAQLGKSGRVTLHWVPRHRNGEADRLSQQAIASWAGLD
jgi:ribonuclease HI